MRQVRVDVSSVLEDLGASVALEGEFALDHLAVGDEVFRLVEPASYSVELTNTGAGIVASGSVSALTSATCARCLEPFELEIDAQVEGFYVQPGHEAEIPEEQEIEPVLPDNTIDLAPALQAALTLEAPFAPVHDESCAGLCPVCGCNLNEEQCTCHVDLGSAGPFAELRGLLSDRED
jgi:uncharacterized protein